ncbi:MAG TPA: hypothetical protein VF816_03055 [Rhodocyclaceae bacterium]
MTISQGDECARHDTAGAARRKLAWRVVGLILLLVLAALAFVGYRQPELLLDYVNLRYCG